MSFGRFEVDIIDACHGNIGMSEKFLQKGDVGAFAGEK